MELQTLKVNTRGGQGKGPARRTRQAGEVPAVIYGDKQDAVAIVIDLKTFDRVIHGAMGEHAIVQLEVADKPEISGPALIKEVQHDPVKAKILHADFMRIRLDERLETVVSVVLVGRAKGVIDGGVIDQQLHEIEIE
ncbi:MAG: 50S ribosomal protein L25, partial [Candidatus Hydrogenedentes bacterium]|nr:50S ribosomal protein L25 [Candidatus Hydrogenedentota bacterium]